MSYQQDRRWADSFTQQVVNIIRQNAMHIIDVREAELDDDTNKATDMVVSVTGGDVAVRVRRDKTVFRDLTLRSWRAFGVKTELQKIRDGFADWYLYAWTDGGVITEWILVSLEKLRESGILDMEHEEIVNVDGETSFVVIPIGELRQYNCIISSELT
jgi:hypothetical protein